MVVISVIVKNSRIGGVCFLGIFSFIVKSVKCELFCLKKIGLRILNVLCFIVIGEVWFIKCSKFFLLLLWSGGFLFEIRWLLWIFIVISWFFMLCELWFSVLCNGRFWKCLCCICLMVWFKFFILWGFICIIWRFLKKRWFF